MQRYPHDTVEPVPIVLLFRCSPSPLTGKSYEEFLSELQLTRERLTEPRLNNSPVPVATPSTPAKSTDEWAEYLESVKYFLQQNQLPLRNKAMLLLSSLAPRIYAEARSLRYKVNISRSLYVLLPSPDGLQPGFKHCKDLLLQGYAETTKSNRLQLRRLTQHSRDNVDEIFRYLRDQSNIDWTQEQSYVGIKTDFDSLVSEASRLEMEMRDDMQLQTGKLAREESRKSIEVSILKYVKQRAVSPMKSSRSSSLIGHSKTM